MVMLKPEPQSVPFQCTVNYRPVLTGHLCCEILDGKHFLPSVPAIKHQAVTLQIAAALLRYAEALKLGCILPGPCDVVLSDGIVIHPDILFIKNERRGLIGEHKLHGTPDLVVEVLSPQTRAKDLKTKKRIYSRYEIQEYWLADPEARMIETLVWSELGYISAGCYGQSDRVSSPLFPTFNLHLARVFETC
jgi:Uma2 family endonuclease